MGLRLLLITFLLVTCGARVSVAELYTAVADMEELLETEAVLMRALEGYIQSQEEKIVSLKRYLSDYAREHDEASRDVQGYLSNPINAYTLVKRLTTDWKTVESLVEDDSSRRNISGYRSTLKFPSDEDLNGAAVALMRLQDTYKMDAASVARGELNGVQYSSEMSALVETPLPILIPHRYIQSSQYHLLAARKEGTISYGGCPKMLPFSERAPRWYLLCVWPIDGTVCFGAGDCFELGRQSYNMRDYYHTLLWMTEALERYNEETNKTASKEEILEYLAFSTYMHGNVHTALQLTDELLEMVPSHPRAIGNRAFYIADIERDQRLKKRGEDGADDTSLRKGQAIVVAERQKRETGFTTYEKLCRGEETVPLHIAAKLHCRYRHFNRPFLRLAPVKEEEAYLSPRIVIFHEVMYDSEIDTIKKLAQPRFKRATVQNSETGELEPASYRISKVAWLSDEEHPVIGNVVRRIEDLTGLTASTAEELQVLNYGIGGHYEPHCDFAQEKEKDVFTSIGTGNRIATFLFYMSDVPQGGATVFPLIKVALTPRKGSAAVWYNLLRSGEGDFRTRHAACPVLTGFKWVANKWLHEYGQEFRRPCTLDRNQD